MFDHNSVDADGDGLAIVKRSVSLLAGVALLLVIVPALLLIRPVDDPGNTVRPDATLPLPAPALLADSKQFLDASDAFRVLAHIDDSNRIRVQFNVASGYYLYRRKISIQVMNGWTVSGLSIPPGTFKTDAYFGRSAVLRDQFEVFGNLVATSKPVPIPQESISPPVLTVSYQGCADDGICYPPITRKLRPTS